MATFAEIAASRQAAKRQLALEETSVHSPNTFAGILERRQKEKAERKSPTAQKWEGLDVGTGSPLIEHGREGLQWLLGGDVQVDTGQEARGTSLRLRPEQIKGQQRAAREVAKFRGNARKAGREKEVEEYIAAEGEFGVESVWNRAWEDILEPTFDTLSAGQYLSASLTRDVLSNGFSWEAFKKAGAEFSGAMPFMNEEGRKKLSYIDLFNEEGYSTWHASVAGFALDILLDPTTYIPFLGQIKPVKMALQAATRGGAAGIKALGSVGFATKKGDVQIKDIFETLFKPNRELRSSAAGETVNRLVKESESITQDEIVGMQDTVIELVGMMTPQEHVMFAAFMDQGEKVLMRELEGLSKVGIVDANRLPELREKFKAIQELTGEIFERERGAFIPLLDENVMVANYVHQTGAMDPRMLRTQRARAGKAARAKMRDERAISTHEGILPSSKKFGPGERAATKSVMDRLEKVLAGDINSGVELNIGNILVKRGVDSVRHLNQRKLIQNIVTDGNVAARAAPEAVLAARKAGGSGADAYGKWMDKALSENPHMAIYDVRTKIRVGGADGPVKEVIGGAWVMPKEIVTYLKKMETLETPGVLDKVASSMDGMLNVWRGWATLGTAFHSRNYQSILFNNWMAGVGTDYSLGKAMKDLATGKGWNIVPGKFALRHLQALRLQMMADGAGRLPPTMRKAADAMAKKAGFKSFDDVVMPKTIRVDGADVPLEEVLLQGQRHDVAQSATKLYNLDAVIDQKLFPRLANAVEAKVIDQAAVSEGTKTALSLAADNKSFGEHLRTIFGGDNPLLKGNRAMGQMVENNGRWALYLDRVMKGSSYEEAAQATKKWHFDYRNLTEIEKKLFRNVLPFYAWTRFAAPRMFMSVIESPEKYARLPKVKNLIESWGGQELEKNTPDYYDEVQAMQLPYIRDDKQLFMQLDLPFLEINRLNSKDILSGLNPVAKSLLESRTTGGVSLFTGAPLERYPGELSEGFGEYGVTRKTEHLVTSFFPPAGKVARYASAKARGEGSLQAVSELFGVKIRALDKPRYTRGQTYAHQGAIRKFTRAEKEKIYRKRGLNTDERD